MATLERDVRLLFLGLLNHVDDAGRCVDNERLIKAAVFPLDDDIDSTTVRRWLDDLSTTRRVILYTVAGRRYLAVANFRKHQKIDRPKESTIPAPDDDETAGQSTFDEGSSNDRRSVDDASLLDQGSGNRERSREQGAERVRPADRKALVRAAAEIVAKRRGCQTDAATKRNPERWYAAAVNGIETDIADQAHRLIHDHPDWDPRRIADQIEPPEPARPPYSGTSVLPPRPPKQDLIAGVRSIRDMLPKLEPVEA